MSAMNGRVGDMCEMVDMDRKWVISISLCGYRKGFSSQQAFCHSLKTGKRFLIRRILEGLY